MTMSEETTEVQVVYWPRVKQILDGMMSTEPRLLLKMNEVSVARAGGQSQQLRSYKLIE